MERLSRRERVRRTLRHELPDRTPVDLGGRVSNIHRDAYRRLCRELGIDAGEPEIDPFFSVMNPAPALLERLCVDFQYLYLAGPEYVAARRYDDGSYENEWGIRVQVDGLHSQRVSHPLAQATLADLARYPWPPASPEVRAAGLAERARRLYEETDYALVAAPVSGGIFEFGQHLRGMAQFLVDLMEDKAFAHRMLDGIFAVHAALWDVFLEAVGPYVEMVQLADDFGTQRSLMISPRLFREMFKPRYAELIQRIRRQTRAKVFLHCDGAIGPLIPDFIEMGVDVLNPLQPTAGGMEPARIKAAFGDRLAFHGAIDNQQLLPHGTPDEVRSAVRNAVRALAPGGGYILAAAHIIEPDVPPENVLAMYDEARSVTLTGHPTHHPG